MLAPPLIWTTFVVFPNETDIASGGVPDAGTDGAMVSVPDDPDSVERMVLLVPLIVLPFNVSTPVFEVELSPMIGLDAKLPIASIAQAKILGLRCSC